MNRTVLVFVAGMLCVQGLVFGIPADNLKVLIGSWNGKATGPQGGPPTGDITVTFAKEGPEFTGKIVVKGAGGGEYSGQISEIRIKDKIFSALAVFRFGESPLEVRVSGPMKGRSIEGTFSVVSKGQKMGDGTFAMTKSAAAPAKK
jgi:hypothetical protein